MDGTRCLLNVGLPDEPGPRSPGSAIDDLLPSLPDPSAALDVYTTRTQDGAGAASCSSLLLEDASSNDFDDDENNINSSSSMSQDLSRALEMSSLCSSPPAPAPAPARDRHRSSVSTISAILLHPGRSDDQDDETARSLSVPTEQEKPGFLAKASSIFFRRNSTPRDQHTQVGPGPRGSRPRPRALPPAASSRSAVKSAAADSLRQQQELEDGLYARVIANFRAIGWCSTSEIESVEYKRSLINAQWDKKISLLSHAQCYK
ncbi:hypothetical protein N7582_003058 [Saccharomyces uvarum]|uniref:Uncharacterized protein n=1 Tax=Saccharomyces uvarum TaxID=230603 RepID=A0AA35NS19_SACUV|nr:hypothetical protein N7582_003058 [Saccharomyces uvarum]CAI4065447.1 hypothetical protein SUVC_09G1820 [Saccharomyces uvarum]